MELHHLRTFVIVADEGSVTKAAQRLYMTPPTISGHIKALEDELSVVLFERTARGMKLTRKGQLLKEKAGKTLLAAQDLVNHATEMQTDLIGEVRLGLNGTLTFLQVTPLVGRLAEDCPGITLDVMGSTTGKILEALQSEQLDCGFAFGEIDSPLLKAVRLTAVSLQIALPPYVADFEAPLSWEAISQLPWIYTSYHCPFQNMMDQLFAEQGVVVPHKVIANDEQTRLNLVRSGVGASLLITAECRAAAEAGELILYSDVEEKRLSIPLQFVYPAVRESDPLLTPVIQIVQTLWRDKSII